MKSFEDRLKLSRKKALSLFYHIDKEVIDSDVDDEDIESAAHRLKDPIFFDKEFTKFSTFNTNTALKAVSAKINRQQRQKRVISLTTIASSVAVVAVLCLFLMTPETAPNQMAESIEISIPKHRAKAILYDEEGNHNVIDSDTREIRINGEVIKNDPSTSSISYTKLRSKKITTNRLKVPRKGTYRLILQDSTVVTLNCDSYLEYPSAFEGDQRRVILIGEALFEVKHKSDSKFVVVTMQGDITVHGTTFNVKSYNNESTTNVTLINGSVALNNEKYTMKLNPGEKATFSGSTNEITKLKGNIASELAWLTNMFDYTDVPLETVAKEIERYYDVTIEFANPRLQKIFVTFYLSKNNDIEAIMKTLTMNGSIKVTKNGTTYTLQ